MCSSNGNLSSSSSPTMSKETSYLFAFDFDHTVVHDNSDTYIFKLLDNGDGSAAPPQHIKDFYDGTNWTEYMNKVFQYMHEKGISIHDICDCIKEMEPTKGMLHLLTTLVQLKTGVLEETPGRIDILVISDANNLFITEYLRARVLDPLFKNINSAPPFDVITNKSSVSLSTNNNLSQPLQISPYSLQTTCEICPKNLCKGSALLKYMESKGPYTRVFYSGDGWNDVCPALKLNQHDYVFPRKGYNLWKKISKSNDKLGINAEVVEWEDAETIEAVVRQVFGITNHSQS